MKSSNFYAFTLLILSVLFPGTVFPGVSLKGSGSALAAPLLLKLTSEYQKLHPDIKIKYEVKNQADAINQILGRGCDFAVSDSPLTAGEEKKTMGRNILHLPLDFAAVVITYNLPGVPSGLKLTPSLLSKIFMGTIKKWNDPAIKEINPGVPLPDMEFQVLHREEESSLHDLFPGLLARMDPKWTLKREKEKNLKWPAGKNIKGNEKVMERLRKWPGIIAAVDFTYALQNHLPMALLRNESGHFTAPTAKSLMAAGTDWVNLPEDFKINLGKSNAPEAYPLCSFSWLLVYQDSRWAARDPRRSGALEDFLNWVYTDGQKGDGDLSYAPLPESFLNQVREKIKSIKF